VRKSAPARAERAAEVAGPAARAGAAPTAVGPAGYLALQRSAGNSAVSVATALAPDVRSDLEGRLGAPLPLAWLHVGREAAQRLADADAVGLTRGRDIYLPSRLDLGSETGRHVLAHELTHVRQQTTPGSPASPSVLEGEAAAAASGSPAASPSGAAFGTAQALRRDELAVPESELSRHTPDVHKSRGHTGEDRPIEPGLTESERAEAQGEVVAPDRLIESSLSAVGFIWDGDLAERLEVLVARHRYGVVLETLDRLRARDKDRSISRLRKAWNGAGDEARVATELARRLSTFELEQMVRLRDARGPELLDRLYYWMERSGSEGVVESSARLAAAKSIGVGLDAYVRAAAQAIVLPYDPGVVSVRPQEGGRLAIHVNTGALSTYPHDRDALLAQSRLFMFPGLVVRESDIIGLKDYQNGERVSYVPAHFLWHLEYERLESFRRTVRLAGEAALALGTLGLSLGGAAVEATLLARAARVLNSATAIVSVISPIVEGSRDWIIRNFGKSGRDCLAAFDLVDTALKIYGLAHLAIHGAELVTRFVSKLDDLISGLGRAKLTPEQALDLRRLEERGHRLASDLDELRGIKAATQTPPSAAPSPAATSAPIEEVRTAPSRTLGRISVDPAAPTPRGPRKIKVAPKPARDTVATKTARKVPKPTPKGKEAMIGGQPQSLDAATIDATRPGNKYGPPIPPKEVRQQLQPSRETAAPGGLRDDEFVAAPKKRPSGRPDTSARPKVLPRRSDGSIDLQALKDRLDEGDLRHVPDLVRKDRRFLSLSEEGGKLTAKGRIEASAVVAAEKESDRIIAIERASSEGDDFGITFRTQHGGTETLLYDVKSFYKSDKEDWALWAANAKNIIESSLSQNKSLLIDKSFMRGEELAYIAELLRSSPHQTAVARIIWTTVRWK
jgi:hypothetical protein